MTIRGAIEEGEATLARAGVATARLEGELLLEHVLDVPRLRLILRGSETIGDAALRDFRIITARRATRIPLQHLVGWAPFLGHRIVSTRDALVPRPETEQLALLAIDRLRRVEAPRPRRVLDIGTGTGCITIAIASEVPDAECVAVELSPDAATLARINLGRANLGRRVELVEGDAFEILKTLGRRFDCIVTNPPYIASAEIEGLDPEVRDHDPRLALDGGTDGLDFHRRLAVEARGWLEPGGWLLAEFGDGQAAALSEMFARAGWIEISVEKDLSLRERVLIVRAPPRGNG